MPVVPRDENSILQAYRDAITTLTAFAATTSSTQGGQERSPSYTFTDVLDRLQIWASDTEAISGRLDYKLRDAPDLRDEVLSLLRDLTGKAGLLLHPKIAVVNHRVKTWRQTV